MSTVRQAIVLAAGQGSRLRALAPVKPLHVVAGLPLLERAIRLLQQAGIEEIIVVSGHAHDEVKRWLSTTKYPVRLVYNPQWQEAENGTSLLAAAPYVRGRFLLLMADHIYEPGLIASLLAAPAGSMAVLAVDGSLQRTDIDLEDVTRVQLEGGRVIRIGKGISPFQGFDTGAFLCEPAVLDYLQDAVAGGKTGLSELMQRLADEGQLLTQRVDGCYWQDVDTPAAVASAEQALLRSAAGKAADGWVARHLNRPLSRWCTARFLRLGWSPNQVSCLAFAMACVAACCMAAGSYAALLIGGVLVQLASMVDGSDGELARLRLAPSEFGGWFDALLDRYADGLVLGAMTWHVMQQHGEAGWAWLGLAAILGSFVASYSAHKADKVLPPSRWRMGRDTRSLLIMVGALLNLPALTLGLIALLMNLAVMHRVWAMRQLEADRNEKGVVGA